MLTSHTYLLIHISILSCVFSRFFTLPSISEITVGNIYTHKINPHVQTGKHTQIYINFEYMSVAIVKRCSLYYTSYNDRYCLVAWVHVILTLQQQKKKKKKKWTLGWSLFRSCYSLLWMYVTKRINLSMWTLSMKIGCNNKHSATVHISSIPLFNQFSVLCCVVCAMLCSVVALFFSPSSWKKKGFFFVCQAFSLY